MKLLFLTSYSPFDELTGPLAGGAERALRHIAERMAARGNEVHYLTFDENSRARVEKLGENLTVHIEDREEAYHKEHGAGRVLCDVIGRTHRYFPRSSPSRNVRFLRRVSGRALERSKNYYWCYKNFIAQIVAEHNIELIHCFSSMPDSLAAATVAHKAKIPLVLRMGGWFWYQKYHNTKDPLKRAAYLSKMNYVYTVSSCLAYNSSALRDRTWEMFDELDIEGPSHQPIVDIGISLPEDSSNLSDPLQDQNINGHSVVSCIAKFKKQQKRQDILVQAAELLKGKANIKFVFAGSGPREEEIKKLALELGVQDDVIFLGAISHDRIAKLIERSDLVVLPTEYEGTSRAIGEAMTYGRAVLASNIPANSEHIRDWDTGVLAQNDPSDFADKVLSLVSDNERRGQIAENAREYAKEVFDPRHNVIKYEKLFGHLVENYRR
jgi:glycosyltransferase involved in cell wall biosynthesis